MTNQVLLFQVVHEIKSPLALISWLVNSSGAEGLQRTAATQVASVFLKAFSEALNTK